MSAAATTELTALPRSPSLPIFFDNLDSFAETPEEVAKLRELILDLAVRGTLVEQDENDEPASALFGRIQAEKNELVAAGKLRKPKPLAELNCDVPYEIPSSWMWTRLGNLQIFTNGFAFKSHDYQDDGVGIVRIGDIQDGEIYTRDMKFVPERFLNELDERLQVKPGDLLIAMSGATTGKLGFNTTDDTFLLNQRVGKIDLLNVDTRYACFFLTTKVQENLRISAGSAIPNLSTAQINDAPFPLPPLSEQRRIVSKVDGLMSLCDELESRGSERVRLRERASRSCLDRLVSSRSRRDLSSAWQRLSDHFEVLYDTPETLAHLRQSILQLAVQGKLVPQDPNDEPAAELHARIAKERESYSLEHRMKTKATETNGDGELPWSEPPGWIWTRLATFFNVVTDGDHLPPPKTEDGIAFLTIGNVTTGELDFTDCRYVPEDYYANLKPYRKPRRGDILYTVVGATYGRPAIVETDRPFCVQRHIAILKPAREVDVSFLKSLLASPFIYEQATRNTSGTAQPTVPLGSLREFLVPLPPLAEQKRIVGKVDQLLSQCDELSARLRDRQSTTQQLLTATIHDLLDEALDGTR